MSKMKMQSVVAGVESRIVKEGQPDQRTIYDVIDGDGVKWTAWEIDLAKRAYAIKGQPAIWEVEQKQNGKYVNRTLVNIEVKGDAGMMNAIAEPPRTFAPSGSMLTPKDTSIHRQCAAKVVGAMAAASGMTPDEFWMNIESLVSYFETGVTPVNSVTTTTGSSLADTPAIPPEVQAALDPFAPVPDDDIPF